MAETETPELPSIFELIPRIIEEVGVIEKGRRTQGSGPSFAFRGIDDVMIALSPLLAKHGVFYVPRALQTRPEQRATNSGGTMWIANIEYEVTFYGPRGDSVIASAWGEAADSSDKASNKALSAAVKLCLLQVFCIRTADTDDPDAHSEPLGPASGNAAATTSALCPICGKPLGNAGLVRNPDRSAPEKYVHKDCAGKAPRPSPGSKKADSQQAKASPPEASTRKSDPPVPINRETGEVLSGEEMSNQLDEWTHELNEAESKALQAWMEMNDIPLELSAQTEAHVVKLYQHLASTRNG